MSAFVTLDGVSHSYAAKGGSLAFVGSVISESIASNYGIGNLML